ncbi:unnamed protein product [Cylicocyclus nassatus]|uniref:EGF-like domain-containing protein n=1 Tax=Cylicocyclus nassatus TaxID=53992 RepID=A0AA36HDN5_CYLNA|nr:unnamed protein product [Cylicocyclus nassatus]
MSGYLLAISWMSFKAGFIQSYTEKSDKLSIAYEPMTTIVHEEVQYVPLGHHAKFRCGAYDDFELLDAQSAWRITELRNRMNYVQIDRPYPSREDGDWKGIRILLSNDTRLAYIYAVDRKMNGSFIECSVSSGFANDKRQPEWKLLHRIEIVVQDCSKNLGTSTISANRLNPCRYGSCRISKDDNLEMLECLCVEQYTGLFCDQPVQGAVLFEILYFLPIFSLLAVLFLVCCFHKQLGSIGSKERPMLLEKHVPKGDLKVDLEELYPEMFITPEKVRY